MRNKICAFSTLFALAMISSFSVFAEVGLTTVGTLGVIRGDKLVNGEYEAFSEVYLRAQNGEKYTLDTEELRTITDIESLIQQRVEISHTIPVNTTEKKLLGVQSISASVQNTRNRSGVTSPYYATGAQEVHTLLCKFKEDPSSTFIPREKSWYEGLMDDQYPGLGHYWNEVTHGKIQITDAGVQEWTDLPKSREEYRGSFGTLNIEDLRRDCLSIHDPNTTLTNADAINMVFNQPLDGYSLGIRECFLGNFLPLDGNQKCIGYTIISGERQALTGFDFHHHGLFAHEMGHGFGMPHSQAPAFDLGPQGYGQPYNSIWDVMSFAYSGPIDATYGHIARYPSAASQACAQFISPFDDTLYKEVRLSELSETSFTIDSITQPNGSNPKLVVLNDDTSIFPTYYFIESRYPTAGTYDSTLPMSGVIIHKISGNCYIDDFTLLDDNVDGNNDSSDASAAIQPGELFNITNDTYIHVSNSTTTNHTVSIIKDSTPIEVTLDKSLYSNNETMAVGFDSVIDTATFELNQDSSILQTTNSANTVFNIPASFNTWFQANISTPFGRKYTSTPRYAEVIQNEQNVTVVGADNKVYERKATNESYLDWESTGIQVNSKPFGVSGHTSIYTNGNNNVEIERNLNIQTISQQALNVVAVQTTDGDDESLDITYVLEEEGVKKLAIDFGVSSSATSLQADALVDAIDSNSISIIKDSQGNITVFYIKNGVISYIQFDASRQVVSQNATSFAGQNISTAIANTDKVYISFEDTGVYKIAVAPLSSSFAFSEIGTHPSLQSTKVDSSIFALDPTQNPRHYVIENGTYSYSEYTGSAWSDVVTNTQTGDIASGITIGYGSPLVLYAVDSTGNLICKKSTQSLGASEWELIETPAAASAISEVKTATFSLQVIRGVDNYIWYRKSNDGMTWGEWVRDIFGLTPSTPSVFNYNGEIIIVVRGTDNKVWQKRTTDGETFSIWEPLPYAFTLDTPLQTYFNDSFYQYVRGTDNRVWYRSSPDFENWSTWSYVPFAFTLGSPSIVECSGTRTMTVRGTDDKVWTTQIDSSNSISGWTTFFGWTPDSPLTICLDNKLYEVVRGTDNKLWSRGYENGAWSNWYPDAGVTVQSPPKSY